MKKLGFTFPYLIAAGLLLTACSTNISKTKPHGSPIASSHSTFSSSYVTSRQTAESNVSKPEKDIGTSMPEANDIAQKTKEYIINGQKDKPSAKKLNWSETFLNQVNIEAVYYKYISAGGKSDDIQGFAGYLTKNAPVPRNWKALFEADLWEAYGEKVSKYEFLQDNLYQVYVRKNGSDVPYVAVNARTGYFHG